MIQGISRFRWKVCFVEEIADSFLNPMKQEYQGWQGHQDAYHHDSHQQTVIGATGTGEARGGKKHEKDEDDCFHKYSKRVKVICAVRYCKDNTLLKILYNQIVHIAQIVRFS